LDDTVIEAVSKLGFLFKIEADAGFAAALNFPSVCLTVGGCNPQSYGLYYDVLNIQTASNVLFINLSFIKTCNFFCCLADEHGIDSYGDKRITLLDIRFDGLRSRTKYTERNTRLLSAFSYPGDRIKKTNFQRSAPGIQSIFGD
jgi:hypothetical protein